MDITTIKRYAKFVVALGGFLVAAGTVVASGDLTSPQGIVTAIFGVTALGVRQVPNLRP